MESVLRVEESLRREGLVKRVGFKLRVASPQGNTRWQCRQLSITFAKETCTSFRSSHCFRVKCETDLSSWNTSSCGVPQGSFLGTLLFIMYISPLRTLISSCSLKHQLYADDIQLFLSFLLTQFNSSTDHLHNAVDRISSWQIFLHRTPLRLNFCSLISVNNLPKSTTPHLAPLCSKPRLHFWWTSHLFWPDLICLQILLLPYSSASLYPSISWVQNSLHHRHFHCSLQAWLVTLSITTCPSLRSPGFNRSRTLLQVLLTKLPNPLKSLPSYSLCTGKNNRAHWI